jgi:putative lipoprotein (rSAM/lipoprotein system)
MSVLILKAKSKLLTALLKLTGLCSLCFVFEACYGTPQADINSTLLYKGKVSSELDNKGIKGIEVKLSEGGYVNHEISAITDSSGYYTITSQYINTGNFQLFVTDTDSTLNGLYENKDTLVNVEISDIDKGFKITDVKLQPK